ncbi:MAG: acetyl-CoA carboxylase carboxyltransferase subunit beta [Alphaproteobacteria bacterium]|nr:acetyl-CoA carboxylase carboxyltransferase subunit beta [Alphaproteobacteria bacterium]
MNWLSSYIRPKIRSIVGDQKDVPDNLWHKCPKCEGMIFHREMETNNGVCHHCEHHMKISVQQRLELLFDDGKFSRISLPKVPEDPLKFRDKKKYSDRLRDSRKKTNERDAIIVGLGKIGRQKAVIAAFNFSFMGGSMGAAVGEGFVKAAETAVKENAALIVVPASGGARMQEGAISLMQMPRTIIGVTMVKNAGLPYIVLLTNPTTGGVSASFAMVGDIHISEPDAMIGFAGKRVIEETIREKLPEDFQTAEFLLDHGMVDMVVSRMELNKKIGKILTLLMDTKQNYCPDDKKNKNGDNNTPPSKSKKGNNNKSSGNVASLDAARAEKNVKKAKKPTEAKKDIPTVAVKTASK